MQKTRVLIADAHTLTREGLKSLLLRNKQVEIIAEATNSIELTKKLEQLKTDVVIIDYDIPGHFSMADISFLRSSYPEIGVLVISTNQNKQDIIKVLDLGVHSYLLKECDEEEIISAIKASAKKEKFFCGRIMDSILGEQTHTCTPGKPCNHCQAVTLSQREVEIINQIAQGYTTKAIADNLFLSYHTVSTHRKNIFKKLQVRSSSELIIFAVENGIISTLN